MPRDPLTLLVYLLVLIVVVFLIIYAINAFAPAAAAIRLEPQTYPFGRFRIG